MTRGRATIGVDIGGTKTLLALFDEKFRLLDHIKERTPAREKFEEFLLSSAAKLARRAEREARELVGVGVGCAGTVDLRGELTASPNVPFLAGYPLRSKLAKAAGAGVTLGNDAQLGLYGEHRLGAAVGLRHVIGAFLGTGVGGALIVDGELYRGAGGAAGELGHFLVSPLGRLAGSERKATLDDLVSRPGIAGEAAAIASRREAPGLERLA
ncbi:MAG TPA: ROK family protein, partial [Elusimicrobiota bacterium]|nr:ROK family protein [Elusimicrobiota bacterium]